MIATLALATLLARPDLGHITRRDCRLACTEACQVLGIPRKRCGRFMHVYCRMFGLSICGELATRPATIRVEEILR